MATLLAKKASGNNPFLTNDETPTQLETEYSDDNVISEVPNSTGVSPNVRDNSTVKHNMPTNSTQTVLTQSGTNTAQGAEFVTNDNSDWINKKWRPVMGWVYMMTCTMDFVVFPILWSLLQALQGGMVTNQWQPITLQGAGLYHIAMGAVLGIAAYGRTKEKVTGTS